MRDAPPGRALSFALSALAIILCSGGALAGARFTPPLTASELPNGTVTIKVVGKGMTDIKVGQAVTLLRGTVVVGTQRTGKDGRANFKGLQDGQTYQLLGADKARSQTFQVPASGGLRFLLFQQGGMSTMTGGGQPSSGQSMPSGHPPVSGTAPGKSDDHGAATVESAKELAPGLVQVLVVKGTKKTPVPGVKVVVVGRAQIQVVKGHPVVAPTAGLRLITDKHGKAQTTLPAKKDDPEPRVFLVAHAKLTYRSRGIVASPDHGHRVTFQIYDRTASTAALKLSPGIKLLSQVNEEAVSFMQIVTLTNTGEAIVHPGTTGLLLPLPEGARNLEVHRVYKDRVHVDTKLQQLHLLTPIPPGTQEVRYFYEVPFSGPELDLTMKLPLGSEAGQASVLGAIQAKLSGPAVRSGQTGATGDTKQQNYLLSPVAAGGVLEITFTGLPHGGKGQTVAMVIALAGVIALWGVFAALGGAHKARARLARRELLLDELTTLERGGKVSLGKAGKKTVRKKKLMQQLRDIWEAEA